MANNKSGGGEIETAAERSNGADFPKHSFAVALKVATALEEKNGGNPLPPTDVAIAIDKSPGSSDFRMLLSSSIKYGLTTGSYNSPKVELTNLGREIVEPTGEEEKNGAIFEAAFRPPLFKRIFDSYKNKRVPERQFFLNALVRDFAVAKEQASRCVSIFLENMEYLGLVRQATTGKWFGSEFNSAMARVDSSEPEATEEIEQLSETTTINPVAPPPIPPAPKNAIFVGHGKNKVPLQQLEKFLTEYKIPHKVAIDEPNRGRPISQKVADLMNECGAAILIFTADEQFQNASEATIWRPSENVVFELGAAGALYGSRIVIFKEKGVDFPSNFRDIGYIEFEKDKLDAKVGELFRELIAFGLITLSVGAVAR